MSPSKARANAVERKLTTKDIVLLRSPATSGVARGGAGPGRNFQGAALCLSKINIWKEF